MKRIKIGEKYVGNSEKPYFIADIAANHDGDLNRAFRLIELVKEAGADAAKFQNFKAKTIVSKSGFERLGSALSHQSSWQKSVYEVYEDASIDISWTSQLKAKCDEIGIEYMTTPYDIESIEAVDKYLNAYKIGSGDITWLEIIEHMSQKGKPIILSTGASNIEDVDRAMDSIAKYNNEIILMQCNTNYTASNENIRYVNLNVLKEYKKRYSEAVIGLSDHTFGHVTVLGAIALGARVIEKHFTDDNNRIGPDHKFSMNPVTWREMVDRSIELWYSLGDGVKKIEDNEKEAAVIQRRSLYFIRDIKKGEKLNKNDLFPLRPIKEDGIPPYKINEIVGRSLNKDVEKDMYLKWEDLV
jgi:sialic acid synthase SpsE